MKKLTVLLTILDGWGIGSSDNSNPIYTTSPKNIEYIKHTYPAGSLQASGIAVGLPWGEEGDSEVGHLTLGAGKVIYQHFPRISFAIQDGSFFQNKKLISAIEHTKKNNSRLHLIGLIGENNIHSSFDHLDALLQLIKKMGVSRFSLHLFADGKDSTPQSAVNLISRLPRENLASISGRYFAMDRDFHWDRTLKTYNAITASQAETQKTQNKIDPYELLENFYKRGLTDEFIEPTTLDREQSIAENDAIIFFNFREDSTRQLAQMFVDPNTGGKHYIPSDLYIVTFTNYGGGINLQVAFPQDKVINPIGKVLADTGKTQLRIAETERYAHVTYFFNGFVEAPFKNEYRVLIPSRSIVRQDEYPEMMARQVTSRVLSAINDGVYDFILVNYANPDVIAHSGNLDAAVKAIEVINEEVGKLMKAVLDTESIMLITSDHGNIERMINPITGVPQTTHELSPVPLYIITKGYERTKTDADIKRLESENTGVLADVAPTILELMGIPKPQEMTGISLLQLLR